MAEDRTPRSIHLPPDGVNAKEDLDEFALYLGISLMLRKDHVHLAFVKT